MGKGGDGHNGGVSIGQRLPAGDEDVSINWDGLLPLLRLLGLLLLPILPKLAVEGDLARPDVHLVQHKAIRVLLRRRGRWSGGGLDCAARCGRRR